VYTGPGYTPVPRERRSVGAMAGGIVLTVAGGVMLLSSLIVAVLPTHCTTTIDGFGENCSADTGAAVGLLIGGLIGLGAGIPLTIWGARRVPVGTVAGAPTKGLPPAWAGAPGGPGWRWQF
jgi:hypothetical protein